jgi:SAM-dependent methyltransferase
LATDPYDQVPYTDHAYAESHPDRLAVVARLSGWQPPQLVDPRILELGCGRGGNLLPMAAGLQGATLVGVDRSARQIDEARRIAGDTGLRNVELIAASFEEAELPRASFDYVVCHGVYSWVPVATRRALLRLIGRSLAPGGIAYVSFNALPGWYERSAARDWLRFATSTAGLARAADDAPAELMWLTKQISAERGAYRRQLEIVGERLAATDRAYLIHEYLAEEHRPEPVSAFLRESEDAGLRYLGDAVPADTALELLPGEVAERARGLDVAHAQELIDFVRCAAFRRTLLVRQGDAESRGWQWPLALDPRAVEGLSLASRLRPHGPPSVETSPPSPEQFDGPDEAVQVVDRNARRALHELARLAPRALPFGELADRVGVTAAAEARRALAVELFELSLATGALDLHAFEPPLATATTDRPKACPVARWHAVHGGPITNRWHQEVVLREPLLGFVLARLDGEQGEADLVRATRTAIDHREVTGEGDVRALVRASIDLLAAAALLIH